MGKLPIQMPDPNSHPSPDHALPRAIRRVLLPLARLLVARGVRFQAASDWLKEAFVAAATRIADGSRLTDSRLSVLTGLQRKDIKAVRARIASGAPASPSAGPLPRLIQNWRGMDEFRGVGGEPAVLPRAAVAGPSFDGLAATVSTDIHPRSLLDELKRLQLVDDAEDGVRLLAEAYIPASDQTTLLDYLGSNIGDHAEAAAANVLSSGSPPHFERAVHYNGLSAGALCELDELARGLQQSVLEQIAARAAELQDAEADRPDATGRFRCGAFILTEAPNHREATS